MKPAENNFTVIQGDVFNKSYVWSQKNDDGTTSIFDLTGYTAKMQLRIRQTDITPILSFTTSDDTITLGGVDGTIDLHQDADVMAMVVGGEYIYSLKLIPNAENDFTLMFGVITVTPQVTI